MPFVMYLQIKTSTPLILNDQCIWILYCIFFLHSGPLNIAGRNKARRSSHSEPSNEELCWIYRWQVERLQLLGKATYFSVPCCCVENYSCCAEHEIRLRLLMARWGKKKADYLKRHEFVWLRQTSCSMSVCYSIRLHLLLPRKLQVSTRTEVSWKYRVYESMNNNICSSVIYLWTNVLNIWGGGV